jgi:flavodoxin
VQTAIIYASIHHGNTRRLAEALAQPLDAALLTVDEAKELDGSALDLIGFGSGIYFGRHHASLFDLVTNMKSLPPHSFVFSTAGIVSLAFLWHRALTKQIEQHGCEVVGQFSCSGWDTVGPLWLLGGLHHRRPNERDLKRAEDFARYLRATFEFKQRSRHNAFPASPAKAAPAVKPARNEREKVTA